MGTTFSSFSNTEVYADAYVACLLSSHGRPGSQSATGQRVKTKPDRTAWRSKVSRQCQQVQKYIQCAFSTNTPEVSDRALRHYGAPGI